MAANAGQTAICNVALAKLGSRERISSIDDGTDNANQMRDVWGMALESTLSAHPWNPATRRRMLDRETAAPEVSDYLYQYKLASLPDGFLRWLPPDRDDEHYFEAEEEDGFLLSNDEGPLPVRYIYKNEDLTRWSPLMREAMANRMAFWLSFGKTQLVGVHDRMKVEFDETLAEAKRIDGLATGRRSRGVVSTRSRWAGARRTGAWPR